MNALTPEAVHDILKRYLPARNDYFVCDYVKETRELADFGITTEGQLVDLLRRRSDELMEIDQSPMDEFHVKLYSEDLGEDVVRNRIQEGFWFAYPALLRIALELEFNDAYREYAGRRDDRSAGE